MSCSRTEEDEKSSSTNVTNVIKARLVKLPSSRLIFGKHIQMIWKNFQAAIHLQILVSSNQHQEPRTALITLDTMCADIGQTSSQLAAASCLPGMSFGALWKGWKRQGCGETSQDLAMRGSWEEVGPLCNFAT